MEYGQQMNQAKDNAKLSFYQNSGYQFERRNKKTFILRVDSDGTINFNETLQEPLIIDRLSDIYLESFLTWHKATDSTGGSIDFLNSDKIKLSAFVLHINEFNNQGNSSLNDGDTRLFNKIIIPHEIPDQEDAFRKAHKSRKLNYICSMNPTTLSSLSGTITGIDGTIPIFVENDMFLAEFVIVARD
jgi:hypothetical protein